MPYLLLAFLSLLWGSSFLLIAIAARGFDPLSFAFVRVVDRRAGAVGIAAARERRWPRGAALWLRLAAMAAFGQAIPFLLLGDAARRVSSGDLALMMGAAPIFAFCCRARSARGRDGRPPPRSGLALGLIGVAICVGGPGGGSLFGKLEGFCAAFCYAAGATISRGASREVGPSTAAAASMTLSSAALGVAWRAAGGSAAALAAIPAPSLLAMAALGVFNTALAYFVYFALVVRMGATSRRSTITSCRSSASCSARSSCTSASRSRPGPASRLVIAGIALTGRAVSGKQA